MQDMFIRILPVLSIVVGAFLQHILARSKEREMQFANIRQQTYADYLSAVAAIATKRTPESIGKLTDAKSRMAIYASNKVVDRLAEFETTGADMANLTSIEAYMEIALQMRIESGSKDTNSRSLQTVLFGIESFSVRSTAS